MEEIANLHLDDTDLRLLDLLQRDASLSNQDRPPPRTRHRPPACAACVAWSMRV
jgi:hypothetical protein